jgi:uncharacterized lipoprotein YmbA
MRFVSVLLMIFLTGCASGAIEPSYYLLRSKTEAPSGKLSPSRDYSLGTVEIAPYLDQPGLVMETAAAQMRPASAHLWAEPIYDGVRNYLRTEISSDTGSELLPEELNQNSTVVNIRIDQLHGTLGGTARIVAYWWLVRGDEVVTLNRYADSRSLQASGYAALVEEEKILLSELARQIAASMVNPPPK